MRHQVCCTFLQVMAKSVATPSKQPNALGKFKKNLLHSYVNLLLVFIPAGIAVRYTSENQAAIFAVNFLAMLPLGLWQVKPLLTIRVKHQASLSKPSSGMPSSLSWAFSHSGMANSSSCGRLWPAACYRICCSCWAPASLLSIRAEGTGNCASKHARFYHRF